MDATFTAREMKDTGRNSFRDGDPRLIDLEDPLERQYWSKSLMVGEDELTEAVGAVGNSAEEVKRWLAAKRSRD